MNKKAITFITGSLTGGGAERVISILANNCAENGAEVSLIILRQAPRVYKLLEGLFNSIR